MLKIQQENIYGWDGYRLISKDVSLGIIPQMGGRIISLTHQGEELFFVQDEFKGDIYYLDKIDNLRDKKLEMGFRVWGGDKTWVSPQQAWWEAIPPIDLDAGSYSIKIDGNTVEMQSPICRETGLRIIRRIRLDDGIVHLQQTFRNETNNLINRGIWNVTQVLRPFEVYLPASRNNIKAYRDEGLNEDASSKISKESNFVKVLCDDNTHFKVGGFIDEGIIVALRKTNAGTLAFSRLFDVDLKCQYAHNASVEIYNSKKYNYLEIEVHAPLVTLGKGQEVSHSQTWILKRFDNNIDPEEVFRMLE
ncbi:MAG: DUF4380 domain-containing protein [Candidatus Omnitrophica bacterium]|nr:DUF4380 domain-containing protein [Candidatus Omnitrophota bacterium]